MAMMGSATAGGVDRARQAAQAAVKSPLLEDVNLLGARGVLVNITASSGLKMREYHEVMGTIKEFTAEDAMVIVGTVIDDEMDDRLRVTMIATGLGGAGAQAKRPPKLEVLEAPEVVQRTGTDGYGMRVEQIDYDKLDQPAVVRRRTAAPIAGGERVRCLGNPGLPAQAGGLGPEGPGRGRGTGGSPGRAAPLPGRRPAQSPPMLCYASGLPCSTSAR